MARFLLHHRHLARECPASFAAWKGFTSPLRNAATISSCLAGGHDIWWVLEAATEADAIECLPRYVAERTHIVRITEVRFP